MSLQAHEALAVLRRAFRWLSRDGGRHLAAARYVEPTLLRFVEPTTEDPAVAISFGRLRDRLSGFDADAFSGRLERLDGALGEIDAINALVGEAPPVAFVRTSSKFSSNSTMPSGNT